MPRVDLIDWAIRVRERADREGIDLHEAFSITKYPRDAWHVIACTTGGALTSIRTVEKMRRDVVRIAGTLVAVELRTGVRRVAV